jgi:hypothetical protein
MATDFFSIFFENGTLLCVAETFILRAFKKLHEYISKKIKLHE